MATSGWNRPSANKPITPRKNNSVAKGLVAGLIVVILAAIAAYFIFSSSERKPTKVAKVDSDRRSRQEKRIEDKGADATERVANRQEAANTPTVEEQPSESEEKNTKKEPGVLFSCKTNNIGLIIERYRLPNGRTYRKERPIPSVLTTASDQLLAMATAGGLGDAPPIPVTGDISEDDNFGAALKKEIIIDPNDPPEVKALKERVKAAREVMLDEMSKGATFSEIIQHEQRMARDNTKTLREVQETINDCLRKGDTEGAKKFYDKFGPALEQMGIEGLTLEPDPEDLIPEEEQK